VHSYDEAGRLVRSTTTSEPRWTPQDRGEVLALTEYRAGLCPGGCGQQLHESTAHYTVGPEYDGRSLTCRACAAKAEASRAWVDRHPTSTIPMLWYVARIPKEGGR
jgi:hypothetical protein